MGERPIEHQLLPRYKQSEKTIRLKQRQIERRNQLSSSYWRRYCIRLFRVSCCPKIPLRFLRPEKSPKSECPSEISHESSVKKWAEISEILETCYRIYAFVSRPQLNEAALSNLYDVGHGVAYKMTDRRGRWVATCMLVMHIWSPLHTIHPHSIAKKVQKKSQKNPRKSRFSWGTPWKNFV